MIFAPVIIGWYMSTLMFYLCIIFGCYFATIKSQNKVLILLTRRIDLWSAIVSGILLFVKGFGTTGRDLRGGYYYNFSKAVSLKTFPDYTVEIGYRILNVIVRNITKSYSVLVFLVAFLSIYPVISLLKKYKNDIDLPVAVLMYLTIFFFSGLSPIRICLAAAFSLYAFDAMIENHTIKALFWVIFASLFHSAALILIIPFFCLAIRCFNKKMIGFSLFLLFLSGYLGRKVLTIIMSGSERYSIYSSFDNVHIGMEQLFYFVPLFAVYFIGKKKDINKRFEIIAFLYLSTAFCLGMLGYIVSIFGRFRDVFLPLIFIVAYYTKRLKMMYPKNKLLINILVITYCIARFYIYISQYYIMEDIMPYTNIWGWII